MRATGGLGSRPAGPGLRDLQADLAGLARLPEGDHAVNADLFHGFAGRLEIVARIELVGAGHQHLADRSRHGDTVVGIDVDLADTVLDAALNLFDRNAPRLLHVAT